MALHSFLILFLRSARFLGLSWTDLLVDPVFQLITPQKKIWRTQVWIMRRPLNRGGVVTERGDNPALEVFREPILG